MRKQITRDDLAWITAGTTTREVCTRLRQPYWRVSAALRKFGIKLARPYRKVRLAFYEERAETINFLRQYQTLREIGERYGISRERVRQIIAATGGPSYSEVRHLARVPWTCAECGKKEMLPPYRAKIVRMHPACFRAAVLRRGKEVVDARLAGKRWLEIAAERRPNSSSSRTNYTNEALQARRYLRSIDAPPSLWEAVFPGVRRPHDALSRARMREGQARFKASMTRQQQEQWRVWHRNRILEGQRKARLERQDDNDGNVAERPPVARDGS